MGSGNESGLAGVVKEHHGKVDGWGKVCVCEKTVGCWYKTHRKYHNVSHFCSAACDPSAMHSGCRRMHRPVIDVYELTSIFFCEFTVSWWWMHSILLVIHLIFSVPQLRLAEQRHMLASRCHHCPPCPRRSWRCSGCRGGDALSKPLGHSVL